MQIVIAGKAHPKDHPGKMLIREIVQLSRDPELLRHIVFLEDYGIQVARELVQGVDLWLNNPRRGEEACGTSGMKAGINGVLNLSILDGWFDEAYEISGGWAIGDREPYSEDQDEIHARAIYSLLENEIVPLYYDRDEEGVPGRVDASREPVADEPQSAVQQPAHGLRVHVAAIWTGSRCLRRHQHRRLRARPRARALESAGCGSVGSGVLRRHWSRPG